MCWSLLRYFSLTGLDCALGAVSVSILLVWNRHDFVPISFWAALFLVTWGIYIADRLVDTIFHEPSCRQSHFFLRKHVRLFVVLLALAIGFGTVLGFLALPLWGIVISVWIGGWVAAHFIWFRHTPRFKDYSTAGIYSAGAALCLSFVPGSIESLFSIFILYCMVMFNLSLYLVIESTYAQFHTRLFIFGTLALTLPILSAPLYPTLTIPILFVVMASLTWTLFLFRNAIRISRYLGEIVFWIPLLWWGLFVFYQGR